MGIYMKNFTLKLLMTCALATSAYASDLSTSRLEDKIHRLERDLVILQRQFYKNDNGGSLSKSYSNVDNSIQESKLQELQEQMRFFSGEIEETKHLLLNVQNQIINLREEMDLKIKDASIANNANLNTNTDKPSNSKSVSNTNSKTNEKFQKEQMQTEFNTAYGFYKEKNYSESIVKFKSFIKQYDGEELSGVAYYWLGESYLGIKDSENAALNFLYSYKKFPHGRKAINSLYKLSSALTNLGKKSDACNAISKLKTNFKKIPEDIKTSIDKESKTLQCKN
jgi:tol-pal system protein YbgF